ncbi:hypothetical protein DCC79_13325 [bacterium]|nr:type II toxin-antitoxin system prevent-host-death family antitoxin [Chloroflexi bacterium CFX6]RIL08638.1 MAG: hypothetical protein DCC79_13325 [bacterium]
MTRVEPRRSTHRQDVARRAGVTGRLGPAWWVASTRAGLTRLPRCGYNGHMSIVVGARELKNRLGSYLRAARGGTRVIITERGRPVAELHGLAASASALDDRLLRMAAEGLITLPTSPDLPLRTPLRIAAVTLSEAIVEDRRDRV